LQDELWSHAHKEIRMRSNRANLARNDLRQCAATGGDGRELRSASGPTVELRANKPPAIPRRTYRKSKKKRKRAVHWWKSHPDAFESVWKEIESWLDETPYLATTIILERLQSAYPLKYPSNKLRTLQRRVKAWRLSQIEKPKHEFSAGDSLPDADAIEIVVHCES